MRPDRIFVGEIRGAEAFSFLRAINTGHPGSMSTAHADTPLGAYEQLAMMMQQGRLLRARPDVLYPHGLARSHPVAPRWRQAWRFRDLIRPGGRMSGGYNASYLAAVLSIGSVLRVLQIR
ncbi:hypothetical protein MesoLjLc_69000 [Mesorhizobium sp. L-8-10]|nr:hypothetical protein MesoLjLc_69000 [Mesorhizobium sp. L-8-10]